MRIAAANLRHVIVVTPWLLAIDYRIPGNSPLVLTFTISFSFPATLQPDAHCRGKPALCDSHHALAASQRLSQVAALLLFLPLLNQTRISAAKAPRNCHHALAASQRLSQGPVTALQF